jgi:hypothetical protein
LTLDALFISCPALAIFWGRSEYITVRRQRLVAAIKAALA